ncbi:MAG: hypothetical protein KUG77_24490, partial [Nannocystaceae bacterium]|nr:hypothetical protein [Nannocystaceae bacterium]
MSDNPKLVETDGIVEARREGLAALAILSDPNCLPRQAAAHIAGGWGLVRGPATGERLSTWLRDYLAALPRPRKTKAAEASAKSVAFIEAWESGDVPAELGETEARALVQTLLDTVRRRDHDRGSPKAGHGPLGRRAAVTLGGVVAVSYTHLTLPT